VNAPRRKASILAKAAACGDMLRWEKPAQNEITLVTHSDEACRLCQCCGLHGVAAALGCKHRHKRTLAGCLALASGRAFMPGVEVLVEKVGAEGT
jgi:hypothetical protein